MKKILFFVLAASLTMFAQGKGGGGAKGGPPAGAGTHGSSGMGSDHRPDVTGKHDTTGKPSAAGKREDHIDHHDQKPLKDSQINSGSFKMLERKSGMTEDQLKAMYASSGARNYGQFVSAVVVSKNLNLDTQAVLNGLKTKSLGQTLKDLGVSEKAAKAEIKKANADVKKAEADAKKAKADARKAAAKNKA